MRYCLVDTAIGTFGLAWSRRGLARVLLPDDNREKTEGRLARLAEPAKVPQTPRHILDRIEAYGAGSAVDFADVVLDFEGVPEFRQRVYRDILAVGWGETTSYGEIALRLGDLQLARAVGQAMGRNPVPLVVPCHRVLAAQRRTGGFSAPGGTDAKLRMLALEGVLLAPPAPAQMEFSF